MGTTNTGAAIKNMKDNMFSSLRGDRSGSPDVAMVVTDGNSDDRKDTFEQAMLARKNGVRMLAVGINLKTYHGQRELQGIASDPDDKNVFNVPNFEGLFNITDRIVEAVCDGQYFTGLQFYFILNVYL